MNTYTIRSKQGNATATVTTTGAYVLSYEFEGVSILYQGESIKRTGIPLLFPFAGPLENGIFAPSGKPMPQHGFARDTEWHMDNVEESSVQMSLFTALLTPEMQAAYPYTFITTLTISLSNDGQLVYTLNTMNSGLDTDLPIAPGIHPYFAINNEDKKQLTIEGAPFDAVMTDWNNIQNHAQFFPFHNAVTIKTPQWNIKMSDNGVCNTLVAWSMDGGEDFVCIEPIARPFNAIHTDPILVKPHEEHMIEYRFIVGIK